MRTVFKNNELPHIWANDTLEYGRNSRSSFFFEGDVIYSYGRHFPIARKHIKHNTHLLTSDSYSNTTAKHIHKVHRSLTGQIFIVPDVLATTKEEHQANYTHLLESMHECISKASRARTYKSMLIADADKLHKQLLSYNNIFELGNDAVLFPYTEDNVKELMKEANKQKREAEKKAQARIAKENATKIKDWQALTSASLPRVRKVYMRVNGSNIETSDGAVFDTEAAKLAFRIVKRCVDHDKSWKRNGERIRLGIYNVDSISSNGTVVAGCHTVEYDQILHCAEVLGIN